MTRIEDDFAAAIRAMPHDEAHAEALRLAANWGPEVTDLDDVPSVITDLIVESIAVEDGTLTATGTATVLVPGVQYVGDALAADTVRPLYEHGVTEVTEEVTEDIIDILRSGTLAPSVLPDDVVEERLVERLRDSDFPERHGVREVRLSLYFEERAVPTDIAPRDVVQERLQRELDLLHSAEYRAAVQEAGASEDDALRMWREGVPVEFAITTLGN